MGADGFVCVRWGAGALGDTKIRQTETQNGHKGHDFGAMAGEISPNIMFGEIRRRGTQMHANGFIWVANGGDGTHGSVGNEK